MEWWGDTKWRQQRCHRPYKFLKHLHCLIVTIDGVHKESLWSILRAYSIHIHIVRVIKQCFNLNFHVKSGVRQGLVISAFLFNTVIDRVLCRATECKRRGIRWTLSTVLEDIACRRNRFAISFFSWYPEENTNYNRLERFAQQVGLQVISLWKSCLWTSRHHCPSRLDSYTSKRPNNPPIWVVSFAVMGGWPGQRERIGKAKGAYASVWKSRNTAEEWRFRSTKLV